MRILPVAALFIYAISITGCGKTDTTFSGAKVLSSTNMKLGYTESYTYNSSGNVSLAMLSTGDKIVYTYTGDTILMEYIIGGSVVSSATRYLLHGAKYADTSFGLYQAQNNAAKYAYNSDGQMTQQKNYAIGTLSSISDYTLTDKNLTSIDNTNVAANTHTYSHFSYNTNSNTVGNQNFGLGFLGVGSVYLPVTQVQLGQNNDTTGIISYKYHYNSNSYVDTLVTHDRNGHLIDSMAYSY